jgi:hypothetical protein
VRTTEEGHKIGRNERLENMNLKTIPLSLCLVLMASLTTAKAHAAASPMPQDLQNFDHFIAYVHQQAETLDQYALLNCFAPMLLAELAVPPDGTLATTPQAEVLSRDIERYGFARFARDVARYADGFALIDQDGTMQNMHASAFDRPDHLLILGDRVKLRRRPGGDVLCLLDQGAYPGGANPAEFPIAGDGHIWRPVVLQHPELGRIKGFISDDYVRFPAPAGPVSLRVKHNGKRWAFTGFKRDGSAITASHDCDH